MGAVVTEAEAIAWRQAQAAAGHRVVFTNGHFELLHLGHVDYLQKARSLGDVLVVGVNGDASTRALKGEGRPLVPAAERAAILAALACVDRVVIFEETTATRLVRQLQPDVYVKGGDWGENRIPPEVAAVEAYGGEVIYVPYLTGYSTSDLIARIVECFGR
ncbi:MAG TPA: ADP-heptose synthase [Anaerolineae bacterium]|nr:ADP-heptose synthase [Anaerolineae bacterium]HIQ04338.1 ADP-heptose synthase [Anaerolineae bacterium]